MLAARATAVSSSASAGPASVGPAPASPTSASTAVTAPPAPVLEQDSDVDCRGTASKYAGLAVQVGTFPPAVQSEHGTNFNLAERMINTGERKLGFHFPILNGSALPSGWETHGRLIHGDVERGSKNGVVVTGSGNSKKAYFDPSTNPPVNEATSSIVLPSPTLGWGVLSTGATVQGFINGLDPEVPVTYRGSETDCANNAGDATVRLEGDRAELTARSDKHERRHAKDWRKTFCETVARRDKRIARRTGAENAKTGWALNDPQKAEERALDKLFRGIGSRRETAEAIVAKTTERVSRVHASVRFGFQLNGVVVGNACDVVLLEMAPESKGFSVQP